MNRKVRIFTIILLVSAGVTSWLTIKAVKRHTTVHINKPDNPDAFMRQITFTQMNSDGSVHSTIYVPSGKHFAQNNSADFQQPHIVVYNMGKQPWHITADQGKSVNGTKLITLVGNVTLKQRRPDNQQVIVTTASATIHLPQKIVTTDKLVTLQQPGLKITAIGAHADLTKKNITLLSHVKESYDPTVK